MKIGFVGVPSLEGTPLFDSPLVVCFGVKESEMEEHQKEVGDEHAGNS